MDPICEGATGAAVEDIQTRLAALGYEADGSERDSQTFGSSTATAVAKFRLDHGLSLGSEVDAATWTTLVDEGYCMGDRTLYLRLPNFHRADVRQLQKLALQLDLPVVGDDLQRLPGCKQIERKADHACDCRCASC